MYLIVACNLLRFCRYIHHFLIADMSKPSAPFALCPNMHKEKTWGLWTVGYVLEAVGAGLIQVGNDAAADPNLYYSPKSTLRSAFLTNKDDIFFMEAEIVNYNPTNRTVYLTLDLEYLNRDGRHAYVSGTDADLIPILDASTVVLSAEGCMPPGYMPPQKERKYTHTSEKFEMTQDGWILNGRGHLHDGGTAIDLELNDTLVCRSLPRYGRPEGAGPEVPETIQEMSWCHNPVRVRKGDYLVVKSHYDLDRHGL
jgi:Stress up-regulated Nod 19